MIAVAATVSLLLTFGNSATWAAAAARGAVCLLRSALTLPLQGLFWHDALRWVRGTCGSGSALLLSQQALPELLQALALRAGSRLPCKGCQGLVSAPGLPLLPQTVELPETSHPVTAWDQTVIDQHSNSVSCSTRSLGDSSYTHPTLLDMHAASCQELGLICEGQTGSVSFLMLAD